VEICGRCILSIQNFQGDLTNRTARQRSKAAGEWQTPEIEFVAPRFDASDKKISNAKFSRVVLNRRLIHENVEVSLSRHLDAH
jgi:hypothetical protein